MTNHLNLPETAEHGSDERMFAPYAERNKAPIFDVLNEVFPQNADYTPRLKPAHRRV